MILELRLFSIACSMGGPGWSGGIFNWHPVDNCEVYTKGFRRLPAIEPFTNLGALQIFVPRHAFGRVSL